MVLGNDAALGRSRPSGIRWSRQRGTRSSLRRTGADTTTTGLTVAGDVLNWDQATYMPRGGADARAVNAR